MKQIPTKVVDILTLINNQNKEAYIIGGAVRDFIIDKIPHDYDLCTNLPLLAIKEYLPHFHLMKQTDLRHAGVIKMGDTIVEISEYKGDTLESDILKRDFTINGIAMDKDGNLIDPFGFQQDIYDKKISLIDKTGESIKKNPLLMLRAIRFACKLGFKIDDNTKAMIFKHKVTLSKIIGQRVYIELSKMILSNSFPDYLEEYFDVFIMIMPELINISKEDFQKMKKLLTLMPENITLRLAALFSYNGNSIQDFTQFANRTQIDKKTIKLVLALLPYKDKGIDVSKIGINRTIHDFNVQSVDLLFAYKKATMALDNSCLQDLSIIQKEYQEAVDKIIQTRIANLQINIDKLVQMGYTQQESNIIIADVKGRIITSSLQNDPNSIHSYILKNYKRS